MRSCHMLASVLLYGQGYVFVLFGAGITLVFVPDIN